VIRPYRDKSFTRELHIYGGRLEERGVLILGIHKR
jgi:hypothetical protein